MAIDPEKAALNKRLEGMAWGAFLIMLGGFMFIPDETVDQGWWSIGVGLIFLGLNAARYFNGLRMSGFTTFLGIISRDRRCAEPVRIGCRWRRAAHRPGRLSHLEALLRQAPAVWQSGAILSGQFSKIARK